MTAVVFDLGETLIDETSAWEQVAREIEVPAFTLMATLGGLIARGEHHARVFDLLDKAPTTVLFTANDLYSDALPCLVHLRERGYFVGVGANTPQSAEAVLRPHVDFVGSSERWGVEKPSSVFFARIVEECARPAAEIAYVGDRVDNDVIPALDAGLVAVHIRRGPWAHLHEPPAGAIRITRLDQLPAALP